MQAEGAGRRAKEEDKGGGVRVDGRGGERRGVHTATAPAQQVEPERVGWAGLGWEVGCVRSGWLPRPELPCGPTRPHPPTQSNLPQCTTTTTTSTTILAPPQPPPQPPPPPLQPPPLQEAFDKANSLGYPVMIRPSYVLGGRAMEILYNNDDLKR